MTANEHRFASCWNVGTSNTTRCVALSKSQCSLSIIPGSEIASKSDAIVGTPRRVGSSNISNTFTAHLNDATWPTTEAAQRERWAIDRTVRKSEAVADSTEQRAFKAATRAVARRAHRETGQILPRKLFTQAVKGADRSLVDLDAVLDDAIAEGLIEQVDENHYRAGRNQPA